ncbi:Auxin-induced protein X15 [Glycine soja]|nr:Auxin-induced protein X15 [Glycine soja]
MGFSLRGVQRRVDVPKGCVAVYVGENQKKRCVIPISYLNQPSFIELLNQSKNLDLIIQWVASRFLAEKMCS